MTNSLNIIYEEYENWKKITPEEYQLLTEAKKARESAYAKYSGYKVGTAVLLANGKIISGNNQENAAYPSGLCAERTAIFYASATYPTIPILKLAISGGKDEENSLPVFPCGSCRQVLLEYETKQNKPMEIICAGTKGKVIKFLKACDLLPFSFNKNFL